jgi:hypothetical protein
MSIDHCWNAVATVILGSCNSDLGSHYLQQFPCISLFPSILLHLLFPADPQMGRGFYKWSQNSNYFPAPRPRPDHAGNAAIVENNTQM